MKKAAYSLAQTLIPVCILICVISILVAKCVKFGNEQSYISQLKIAYRYLTESYITTANIYGNPTFWHFKSDAPKENGYAILLALSEGMQDMRVFTEEDRKHYEHSGLDGKVPSVFTSDRIKKNYSQAIVGENMHLYVTGLSPRCDIIYGNSIPLQNVCGQIIVDLNGINKPNVFGKDTYLFYITSSGIVPAGLQDDFTNSFEDGCNLINSQGYGCTAWVLMNQNLDYLECSNLSWDKTRCK